MKRPECVGDPRIILHNLTDYWGKVYYYQLYKLVTTEELQELRAIEHEETFLAT